MPKGQFWTTTNSDYIVIYNTEPGNFATLFLFPAEKIYRVEHTTFGIDPNTEEAKRQETKPKLKVTFHNSFYAGMREYPAERATKVPNRILGGKEAAGFQFVEKIERPEWTATTTKTYWVDPRTKLPVRIETQFRPTNPMVVDTDWVESDFVFDAPLDVALFSTDPPAGYHKAVPHKPPGKKPGGEAK